MVGNGEVVTVVVVGGVNEGIYVDYCHISILST